jgi:glycine amidinotransferase
MPRPLMTDRSFDVSYVKGSPGGPAEFIENPQQSPYDVGYEMMFDGAQCLRLGSDIMVNIATKNHELAVEWLERYLEDRFRLHRVYGLADNHIDSKIIALRPGLLLVRNQAVAELLPASLQK